MSFWAGIQRAINSTLGTDEFQPLDKLIKDGTKLVASYDYVLTSLNYNSGAGTSEEVSFSCDGTIYFSASANLTPPTAISTAYVLVTVQKKNESGVWEDVNKAQVDFSGSTSTSYRTARAIVNIERNSEYRMRIGTSNGKVDASSLRIEGLPVSAYLEITKS